MSKKVLLLFVFVYSCVNIFGQQAYRIHSSLELYPSNSSLFFVQTKNAEQVMKIKEKLANNKNSANIIATLSENAIIVNSKSLGKGSYVSDIYQDKEGLKLIMLPRFAIKMKNGHDIEEVLSLYGKRLVFDQKEINVYKVDCNVDNAEEVLALNTEINLLESVEWCEPMMIGEARKCNEFVGYQYYIKNTGQNGGSPGIDINVEPAWDVISANSSLIVAVLDDGVERNHEDLSGSVLNGMTIDYPNEYGDPINEYNGDNKAHGTACAGIIAAKDNTIGIKGVANGVKILPINIYPYSYSVNSYPSTWYEKIGQAITWAYNTKGADVISCSNHFSDNIYITNAINNAMTYGRNGKGTVVVCSSGNSYSDVYFPANMPGTIAVGAIDKTGNVWAYSGKGSSLDLVAPSGATNYVGDIVTTDRMGNLGFNPPTNNVLDIDDTQYTQRFGGTSAACPQVAGVVALMLSANPNLTVNNVRSILQNTARKLPGMNGLNRTDDYGYGLVDAFAAVRDLVNDYSISGPSYICSSSTGVFSISDLPSYYNVNWYLSDGFGPTAPTLQISGNSCTINNNLSKSYMGVLHADIYYQGTLLKTLLESVVLYSGFYGTYSINGGSTQQINSSNSVIWVNHGDLVEIKSPNLVAKNVSYSVVNPYLWQYYTFSGALDVGYPSTAGNNPIVISVQNNTNYSSCDNSHQITLMPTSVLPHYLLKTTGGNGCINVELITERNEEALKKLRDLPVPVQIDETPTWMLEVIDANLGEKVLTKEITGNSTSVSLPAKSKGVFVVRATIGKEVLTEKIQVK